MNECCNPSGLLTVLGVATAVTLLAGVAAAYHTWYTFPAAAACQQVAVDQQDDDNEFANWSATHRVRPRQLFEPETTEELQKMVAQCHASGKHDMYQHYRNMLAASSMH